MTSTAEDPAQYFYLDLHLGNVKLGKKWSGNNMKFIDYGSTYSCCDAKFANSTVCDGLPTCDEATKRKYLALTSNFMFLNLLELLTGNLDGLASNHDYLGYITLRTSSMAWLA